MEFDIHAPKWARELLVINTAILEGITTLMSSPLVTIDPTLLANFVSGVETAATSVNTAAGTITSAVAVLSPYIQQLLSNQSNLQPADQAVVNQAATDLGGAASTLAAAVSALAAIEPPAPTPAPEPTPAPAPEPAPGS